MDVIKQREWLFRRVSEKHLSAPKDPLKKPYPTFKGLLEEGAKTGQFSLTGVIGLPEPFRMTALLWVNGGGAQGQGIRLEATLKNVSEEPVDIKVGYETKTYKVVYGSQKAKETSHMIDTLKTLEPGEEITLGSKEAINALWKYCDEAHDDIFSIAGSGKPIASDSLREVAGSFFLNGQRVEYLKQKKTKVKKAVGE